MDSNDLERERGITILAKCTSILWNDTRINIVDTPGHADFGGEVERILNMVDGAIVLVDASEGPLPQTKFVVSKALKQGLRPIVAINKIDRPDERHDAGAERDLRSVRQRSMPPTSSSTSPCSTARAATAGWPPTPRAPRPTSCRCSSWWWPTCRRRRSRRARSACSPPRWRPTPISAASSPAASARAASGPTRPSRPSAATASLIETARVTKVLAFRGLERTGVDLAEAGDIVAIAGITQATVADTLCDPAVDKPFLAQPIDPPTLAMMFRINDGPFAGQEGDKVQSRVIRDRLLKEAERNVAIRVTERGDSRDAYEVAGRGELQLGILIETMRREGFELTVSRPQVLFRTDPDTGKRLEPIEEVIIDVDEEHSGIVVQKLSERRGDLTEMRPSGGGRQRLVFHVPTRGLIGYQGELLTDTRGTAVMNRLFHGYVPHKGEIPGRRTGVLISNATGEATAYSLFYLQDRGAMIIDPQTRVYAGMIVGEHTRDNDLVVNVIQGKKLTNVRASGKDENMILTPPLRMTLERALSYIDDDELVEITPKSIRLRKRWLDPNERKRRERAREAEAEAVCTVSDPLGLTPWRQGSHCACEQRLEGRHEGQRKVRQDRRVVGRGPVLRRQRAGSDPGRLPWRRRAPGLR